MYLKHLMHFKKYGMRLYRLSLKSEITMKWSIQSLCFKSHGVLTSLWVRCLCIAKQSVCIGMWFVSPSCFISTAWRNGFIVHWWGSVLFITSTHLWFPAFLLVTCCASSAVSSKLAAVQHPEAVRKPRAQEVHICSDRAFQVGWCSTILVFFMCQQYWIWGKTVIVLGT